MMNHHRRIPNSTGTPLTTAHEKKPPHAGGCLGSSSLPFNNKSSSSWLCCCGGWLLSLSGRFRGIVLLLFGLVYIRLLINHQEQWKTANNNNNNTPTGSSSFDVLFENGSVGVVNGGGFKTTTTRDKTNKNNNKNNNKKSNKNKNKNNKAGDKDDVSDLSTIDPVISALLARTAVRLPETAYETSPQCPNCRHVMISKKMFCGVQIERLFLSSLSSNNTQNMMTTTTTTSRKQDLVRDRLTKAYLKVSQKYPIKCAPCHPDQCLVHDGTTNHDGIQDKNSNRDKNNNLHNHRQTPLKKRAFFKYWRFDRSSPQLAAPGVTHYLPSIPQQSRLPNDVRTLTTTFNVTQFMHDKWNNGNQTDIFVEYNPTLTTLPTLMQQRLTQQLTSRRLQTSGNTKPLREEEVPVYLASFRVSSNSACYPWEQVAEHFDREQFRLMKDQNYLGLALLTANLTMIPNTDIVVDLETELGLTKFRPGRGQYFVDYRLFTFNDKIYMNMNGAPVYLVPIQVEVVKMLTATSEQDAAAAAAGSSSSRPTPRELLTNHLQPIWVQNKFGHGMRLILERAPNTIHGMARGKNYALFQTPELAAKGELAAELAVLGDRWTLHFQPDVTNYLSECESIQRDKNGNVFNATEEQSCPTTSSYNKQTLTLLERMGISCLLRRREVNVTSPDQAPIITDDMPPAPTFSTLDELWFPSPVFKQIPHGGACCAHLVVPSTGVTIPVTATTLGGMEGGRNQSSAPPITLAPGSTVLVGVGHTKIPYRKYMKQPRYKQQRKDQPHHQYVSFLYAFEPIPPYRIVARSGLFCLPFADDHHEQEQEQQEEDAPTNRETNTNAYSVLTRLRKLNLKRRFFDCPQISFVSSIIDHGTDPMHKVIISYGINDCTPRMVVIDKVEIAKLLFYGLDDDATAAAADNDDHATATETP